MTSSSIRHYGDESPIAAFATTPGNSALTLIRCSGKSTIDLVSSVFATGAKTAPHLKDAQGNTVVHGWIADNAQKIDEVLVSVFRAPKSYTGEDSVDICCHGGLSAGKAVMAVLKSTGFQDALPGEFTFRAFMNGKLDLTRSESVMELVSAKTETSRRHAVKRLGGSLQAEINEIKNLLVQVLAAAEIYLDYSEEEVSADNNEEIAGKLPKKDIALDVLARLKKLSASWQLERIYQEGITLVIAGRPNAGKSSFFDALLKEDRSIVTEIPGTTRDWIEAWVTIEGIPIRLIDTAGLRDTGDSVEKIGVERSLKILEEADIVLYLIDGAFGITDEDNVFIQKADIKHFFVWNKCDLSPLPNTVLNLFPAADRAPICVSAKTGEGLDKVYAAVTSAIVKQAAGGADLKLHTEPSAAASLGTVRQKKLVDAACLALEEALALTEREEPLDLIAPLLREAVNSLGEITGEVSTADILEEMFSRFCVGK
ncbi:MAG: tRNA uridine-5-carboxymethylaminomethyl(34) synthesis GTPase MnmE [Treponema sp.]|nr:tRNA uridine-5-carboxymethylaminomethyl(34) synthesis GTPase MnmE [Treponema sp.]